MTAFGGGKPAYPTHSLGSLNVAEKLTVPSLEMPDCESKSAWEKVIRGGWLPIDALRGYPRRRGTGPVPKRTFLACPANARQACYGS